ncbi:MAG: terminase small subunit [Stappiaceae bacterium]
MTVAKNATLFYGGGVSRGGFGVRYGMGPEFGVDGLVRSWVVIETGQKSLKISLRVSEFVSHYLADPEHNGARAAEAAGYTAGASAQRQATRLLSDPDVRAEIARRTQTHAEKLDFSAERVLEEMARMAFYDPGDFAGLVVKTDEDGEAADPEGGVRFEGISGPEQIRALPENVRRAITGWKWDGKGNFVLTLADKAKALDQLARHLGLYSDRLDVTVQGGLAERLARARSRDRGQSEDQSFDRQAALISEPKTIDMDARQVARNDVDLAGD